MNPLRIVALSPILTTALLAPLTTAQEKQEKQDPAVQALLAKIEQQLGKPHDTKRSMAIKGTYSIHFQGAATDTPVAQGPFEEHFVGLEFARHKSVMGDHGTLERGVQKELVWEVDGAMGAKVHQAANAAAVRRYYAIMAGFGPHSLYPKAKKTGSKKLGDHEVTVLEMSPKRGKPDTWFVGDDGRVHRIDMGLPSPESSAAGTGLDDLMTAEVTFSDWRKVGTATLPFRRTMKMGPAIVAYVCKTIEVGKKIDEATFAPPQAVTKVERKPASPAFGADGKPNYQIVERKEQLVASIRVTCKPSEISKQLATLLPEVMAGVTASGAQMAGAPFSRYHSMGPDKIDLEAGIPVKAKFEAKGRVKNGKLPGGKTVTCWHVGPYHGLGKAHQGLSKYAADNKLKTSGGPWEIYWTDPGMVPDQKKWRTQLFLPIK